MSLRPSTFEADPAAVYAWMAAFMDELSALGVETVCVSPGSRSTPLAIAAWRAEGLAVRVHLDERSAGFFALGLAKASRRPVALVCTSGTAAANYLPAAVEAHHAGVPLLLLTADRPPELQSAGAGQTIDQVGLYGSRTRLFAQVPPPESGSRALRHARGLARRAVEAAVGSPPGPVHLNFALREPLPPPGVGKANEGAGSGRPISDSAPLAVTRRLPPPAALEIESLCERLRGVARGVITCGPMDAGPAFATALVRLARRLRWPIIADPASQLRAGAHCADAPLLSTADWWLRAPEVVGGLRPRAVLRFGASPVSKALAGWLAASEPETLVCVHDGVEWPDPGHLAHGLLRCDPARLCEALADRVQPSDGSEADGWLETFVAIERAFRPRLDLAISEGPPLGELVAVRRVVEALPDDATLYVSNSMPIRDLDAVLAPEERRLRVLASRGASGIDGVSSSALGASLAPASDGAPTVLLTGDLAFLHDVGGLAATKQAGVRVVFVVIDNDGGGIFSFLPVAEQGADVAFDALFHTPHGLPLEKVAALYDLPCERVESRAHLDSALKEALARDASSVIIVPTDTATNVTFFREIVGLSRETARSVLGAGPRRVEVDAAGVRLSATIEGEGEPVLVLHGFTGDGGTMAPVADALRATHRVIRVDLVGHGASQAPDDVEAYRMEACLAQLRALEEALGLERPHLVGYSMGGRVALAAACEAPERYASLVLIGASPGLESETERAERRRADEALADRILEDGLEAFVDRWMALPLFASQKRLGMAALARARAQRLKNGPRALALSLRGLGTGAQPPLHDHLASVDLPVLLVVGDEDAKFQTIARQMAERLPRAEIEILPEAGHAAHLENPAAFARAVESFLARPTEAPSPGPAPTKARERR